MAQPGFWDKPDAARRTVEEIKTHKGSTQPWLDQRRRLDHAPWRVPQSFLRNA